MRTPRYEPDIAQGSQKFSLVAPFVDASGAPIDFSAAVATLKMLDSNGTVVINDEPAVGGADGKLTYLPDLAGDFDLAGEFATQWTATWPDGRVWRSPGPIYLRIKPKL